MKLEIDIPKHQYKNIMALDSINLGRAPYKGIIMYAINAIKRGKALKQEPMVEIDLYSVIKQKYIEREVLDKIRAEIIKYEGDCRLSVDEYISCKQCTDNVFKTIYGIIDKYKAESEGKE